MRAVIQRVSRARVVVEEKITGAIESGVVALIGVGCEDTPAEAAYIADKIAHLRIFEDEQGKMNRSLLESGGAALVISQFTLYGDVRRGRRPGFDQAATHEQAEALYEDCLRALRSHGVRVETGVFRAQMSVELTNEGPVTILVDSAKLF